VWALMAQAELARQASDQTGFDTTYRYFTYLSPAHRAADAERGPVYGAEPYVMAGDVYTAPPYVGRGGWSWYTGTAAWMHRAAIESIFGLQQDAYTLCFKPGLPSHWPRAELSLRRGSVTLRFVLVRTLVRAASLNAFDVAALADVPDGAQLLLPGQALAWPGLEQDTCFVVPMTP
jgi:cyclic beta-1,2-glucan synthetase